MLISELIEKLEEVKTEQGDCVVLVDSASNDLSFESVLNICGKWYSGNMHDSTGKPINRCFVEVG